jgi:hypothetical protein
MENISRALERDPVLRFNKNVRVDMTGRSGLDDSDTTDGCQAACDYRVSGG